MSDIRHTLIFQEVAAALSTAGFDVPLGQVRAIADQCCQRLDKEHRGKTAQQVRPVLWTAKETAKLLRCSLQMLRRFVDEEGLRVVQKNPGAEKVQYLFRPEDVRDFLELKSANLKRRRRRR